MHILDCTFKVENPKQREYVLSYLYCNMMLVSAMLHDQIDATVPT